MNIVLRKILLIVLFLLFFYAIPISADRIILKNGDVIQGRIITLNGDYLLCNSLYGSYRIPRQHIQNLVYESNGILLRIITFNGVIVGTYLESDANGLLLRTGKSKKKVSWDQIQTIFFGSYWQKSGKLSLINRNNRGSMK